jgi:putative FmdB family regulatory protein
MPLYEYLCRECDTKFEAYVRAFAETVRCPACHAGAVEKQLSTFAMAFSGGAAAGGSPAGGGCGCGRGGCGCH